MARVPTSPRHSPRMSAPATSCSHSARATSRGRVASSLIDWRLPHEPHDYIPRAPAQYRVADSGWRAGAGGARLVAVVGTTPSLTTRLLSRPTSRDLWRCLRTAVADHQSHACRHHHVDLDEPRAGGAACSA